MAAGSSSTTLDHVSVAILHMCLAFVRCSATDVVGIRKAQRSAGAIARLVSQDEKRSKTRASKADNDVRYAHVSTVLGSFTSDAF